MLCKMYYFSLSDIYEKNKKHIHDFLFHGGVYLTLAVINPIVEHYRVIVNPKTLLLIVILLIYSSAFFIVRKLKLKSQFGGLFSHNLGYTIFLALTTFWFYLLFVRPRLLIR